MPKTNGIYSGKIKGKRKLYFVIDFIDLPLGNLKEQKVIKN
jgi:hypothetical protein